VVRVVVDDILDHNKTSITIIRPPLLQWKSGLIRALAPLKGDNLVELYYLCESEIWPIKMAFAGRRP